VSEGDPVSWYLIEPGWAVHDSQGEVVGHVEEVAGDSTHDIFDGLSVAVSVLGKARYVPSEQVGQITEGHVHLTIGHEAVQNLQDYEEPATSAEIEPEKASLLQRAEQPFAAPIHKHAGTTLWERIMLRLRELRRRV
jgi:Uncharacterized protein conserved in bacteria (DUF2171)